MSDWLTPGVWKRLDPEPPYLAAPAEIAAHVPSLGAGYSWPANCTDCPGCGGHGEIMIAVRETGGQKPPVPCRWCRGVGTWTAYEQHRGRRITGTLEVGR